MKPATLLGDSTWGIDMIAAAVDAACMPAANWPVARGTAAPIKHSM